MSESAPPPGFSPGAEYGAPGAAPAAPAPPAQTDPEPVGPEEPPAEPAPEPGTVDEPAPAETGPLPGPGDTVAAAEDMAVTAPTAPDPAAPDAHDPVAADPPAPDATGEPIAAEPVAPDAPAAPEAPAGAGPGTETEPSRPDPDEVARAVLIPSTASTATPSLGGVGGMFRGSRGWMIVAVFLALITVGGTLMALSLGGGDDPAGTESGLSQTLGGGSIGGGPAALSGDLEAMEAAKAAQNAIETYAATGSGGYEGADAGALRSIDGSLPDSLSVQASAEGYTVAVASAGGTTFSISRAASGVITFTCGPPGSGDCPTSGSWG